VLRPLLWVVTERGCGQLVVGVVGVLSAHCTGAQPVLIRAGTQGGHQVVRGGQVVAYMTTGDHPGLEEIKQGYEQHCGT
jgi:hypothetical protein